MSAFAKRYERRILNEYEFNGMKYFNRGLTQDEIERAENLDKASRNNFYFGCGMLDEDGNQGFTQAEGETDVDFAARVKQEMKHVPLPTIARTIEEIVKTTMPPRNIDGMIKN